MAYESVTSDIVREAVVEALADRITETVETFLNEETEFNLAEVAQAFNVAFGIVKAVAKAQQQAKEKLPLA